MLNITLLGTGGMVPLPDRFLTSLLVRYNGTAILIDCGEGTQVAIRAAGLGFKQIDVILLTHFHADHTAGLPGLLLTIGNSGKTTPMTIVGPKYVDKVVDCLRVIAGQLSFEVKYLAIDAPGELLRLDSLTVSCHPVEHWVTCYAYRINLSRQPKFDADKARALAIPIQLWSLLQRGESVTVDGVTILPEQVTGEARKGLSLAYTTDLRPSDSVADFAAGSDLFVCEGMYGDPDLLGKAIEHRHCLFTEAAAMAKRGRVKQLWLTHYSPSMPKPKEFLRHATDVFPNTRLGEGTVTLRFED